MTELLGEALKLYNFPLTVALGLILGFWIMTIVGVLDTDSVEPDLDIDGDLDVDADGGTGDLGLLRFFNLGEVPLMVLLSILILSMWTIAILTNYYLNPSESWLLAAGFFTGNFVVSLFLMKFLTLPLKPLMRSLKAGTKHLPVVGRTCVIKTSEVTTTFGQAEAEDENGAPLLILVRVSDPSVTLRKGDVALVVDHCAKDQTYLVRKVESIDTNTINETDNP